MTNQAKAISVYALEYYFGNAFFFISDPTDSGECSGRGDNVSSRKLVVLHPSDVSKTCCDA